MSTSKLSGSHDQKPSNPALKKDVQSSSSAELSSPSKTAAMAESRNYGVSVEAGVSATLVAYGIVADLYTAGLMFGLPVGEQKNIEIFPADAVSTCELKLHVESHRVWWRLIC